MRNHFKFTRNSYVKLWNIFPIGFLTVERKSEAKVSATLTEKFLLNFVVVVKLILFAFTEFPLYQLCKRVQQLKQEFFVPKTRI